jgi:hypothetical protein
MKKQIGFLITFLAMVGSMFIINNINASTTLYECYKQSGLEWGSVQMRAESGLPAQYGIFDYQGTAEQNIALSSYLCPDTKDGLLGYSVATGYKTTLRTSMTASQNYIPVSSMDLKDDTTLTASDLGGKVFLTVEPGTNKEEILLCTSSTATNWTSCTRGLAFSGTTETAVASNAKTHNAGSVVVMSNVHYVYEQYVENNENDLTFGDGTSTTMKTITFDAGGTYDPGFRWNTSTNQLEFRRYDESSYRVMETNFRGTFADFASLPSTDLAVGDTAITLDDYKMYTWNDDTSAWVLIGGSSGAGTIYKTELLGSEATGADNRTYTLTSGSWPDEKFLQVYRNGVFMRQGASYDYVATTTNAILQL